MADEEDPRVIPGISCGVTTSSGTIEWICIKKVHAKVYRRRRNGRIIFANNPQADTHYFVRRYPNRTGEEV